MAIEGFLGDDAFLDRELLRLALDSSDIGVWRVDPRTRTVELTQTTRRLVGIPPDVPVNYDAFFDLVHPEDRVAARTGLAEALDPAGPRQCMVEFRVVTPQGETRSLYVHGAAFFEQSRPSLFIGTMRDVSVRKAIEAMHRDAVEQQELLLHEVNHRVKNSLQLVSSLLRLQARRLPNREIRRQLEDATTRISTIAHIHQRLYRDQNFRQINFGALLGEICADLQVSQPNCPVSVRSPDFVVVTDRAIPLALIVNELVTNAFKYAYPDHGGPVAVSVRVHGPGEMAITVEDQGVGLPAGFTVKQARTLGMTLIGSLIGQLSGRLEIPARDQGASFVVIVPTDRLD
jgi:PAS domain S-box-containing protein